MPTDALRAVKPAKAGQSIALTNPAAAATRAAPVAPVAELLACPPVIGELLGKAVQRRQYAGSDILFAQGAPCEGLFLLMEGDFARSALRREKRLPLGSVHNGSLVELAAVLGNGVHNYTLSATGISAALLFPLQVFRQALELHPPLRMRLLEELGREVSRVYGIAYLPRRTRNRAPRPLT